MSSFVSKIRLFPVMIAVAVLALGMRGISMYAGYNLITQPAVAAETASAETEQQQEDSETPAEPTNYQMEQPLIVGLPSNEEMELITQLRERRIELEKREQELDLQRQLLATTEKRMNDKIEQLKMLEERIKVHLKLFEKREEERLASIVKVYETMKPKEAAPRFEALGLETQLELVTRMKPAKVAALMEKMTPRAASVLTTELATLAQPPRIEDMQK